jgi:uncharacterized protein YjbJ (UPF0337 family)
MAMQDTRANSGSGSTGAGNSTVNQVKEAGGQVIDQATEKVNEFVDQAKPQVQNQIDSQRERVAENLGSTASTLRETGQQLRSKDEAAMVGEYMERAAEGVDRFAGYLRSHPVDKIMHDAEDFARRQPAIFLFGAFGLGLLAARFLKSSASGSNSQMKGRSWSGSGRMGYSGSTAGYSNYQGSSGYSGTGYGGSSGGYSGYRGSPGYSGSGNYGGGSAGQGSTDYSAQRTYGSFDSSKGASGSFGNEARSGLQEGGESTLSNSATPDPTSGIHNGHDSSTQSGTP